MLSPDDRTMPDTKPDSATDANLATITGLVRYPVKSLTPQALEAVTLEADACLPHDRRYAIAHGAAQFDSANPAWVAKRNFAVLAKHDQLAALTSDYDPEPEQLSLSRHGKVVTQGDLKTPAGRAVVEQFLNAFLDAKIPKPVKIVRVPDAALTDQAEPLVSIINQASLRDLERVMGAPIDPRRFRGNILVDTGTPWSERQWVGGTIRLGDTIEAEVVEHIGRCAAINVDPDTAVKDMNIPPKIVRTFGHMDCGVFIRITKGGELTVGEAISLA